MSNISQKTVKLLDKGSYLDITIDIANMSLIRDSDKKAARILGVRGNVLYVAGKTPNVQNVVVFDEKYAVAGAINSRNIFYNQPLGIWRADKSKAIYFEIAKNACSSVVSGLYKHNWKTWWSPSVTRKRSIWDVTLWHKGYFRKKYLIPTVDYEHVKNQFESYTRFLVYDDPLKRFMRALNNKYISHHTIASMVRPPYDKDVSDFVDKVILVTQLDCLNTNAWDQHLAPITLNAAHYLPQITDFVHLKDLDNFMQEKFKIKLERHNAMPQDKKVVFEDMLLPYQIERIKKIYAKDYEIPVKYSDKFYSP